MGNMWNCIKLDPRIKDGKKVCSIKNKEGDITYFEDILEEELDDFLKDIEKKAKKEGKTANEYLDELADARNNIFNRISEGRFTKKVLKSNIDLVDEAGNTLFRLAKEDYEKFISFAKKTSKERKNIIEEVNLQLKSSGKKYNPENAKLKGYDVPKSKVGTSPDFSTTPQYLYNNKSMVKIKIKGSRDLDFEESFKAIGITDKKMMKYILEEENFTWHHLDDLSAELECTMQLVKKKAHRACYTHFGSAGQAQKSIPLKKYLT